jgi:hypothetical protein
MRHGHEERDHVRRLARHLITILSAVSLLLCVAVCVLWVRSYHSADNAYVTLGNYPFTISSLYGEVSLSSIDAGGFAYIFLPDWRTQRVSELHVSQQRLSQQCQRKLLGIGIGSFTFQAGPGNTPMTNRVLVLPCWLIASILLIPTSTRLVAWGRRRQRRHRDLCVNCGYDLRASPERCPECATPKAAT